MDLGQLPTPQDETNPLDLTLSPYQKSPISSIGNVSCQSSISGGPIPRVASIVNKRLLTKGFCLSRHTLTKTFKSFVLLGLLGFSIYSVAQFKYVANMIVEFTGYGGDGGEGALTVDGVANGPTNPIYVDSVRTYLTSAASAGATSLTVDSIVGFANGDELLVISMLGATAGTYETVKINGAPAGNSLPLATALSNAFPTYSAWATVTQVIKVPNYTTVTINSGGFITTNAFNGQTGGVLFFRATGDITVNYNATMSGTISASAKGFPGGISATGRGPGGGVGSAGGTNTTPGSDKRLIAGSGGGGSGGTGGAGGGIILIKSEGTLTMDGVIESNGGDGVSGNSGGGSGGTILISSPVVTKTTTCGPLEALGGQGIGTGTDGGNGRINIRYLSSLGCTQGDPPATTTYEKYLVK